MADDETEGRERIEELRNNLVRVLGRVHELEGLEDFADSVQSVMADDDFDSISINTHESSFILTIDILDLE